jgi:hypothetical protein
MCFRVPSTVRRVLSQRYGLCSEPVSFQHQLHPHLTCADTSDRVLPVALGADSAGRASDASTKSSSSLSPSLILRAGPPEDGDLRGGDFGAFLMPAQQATMRSRRRAECGLEPPPHTANLKACPGGSVFCPASHGTRLDPKMVSHVRQHSTGSGQLAFQIEAVCKGGAVELGGGLYGRHRSCTGR